MQVCVCVCLQSSVFRLYGVELYLDFKVSPITLLTNSTNYVYYFLVLCGGTLTNVGHLSFSVFISSFTALK